MHLQPKYIFVSYLQDTPDHALLIKLIDGRAGLRVANHVQQTLRLRVRKQRVEKVIVVTQLFRMTQTPL